MPATFKTDTRRREKAVLTAACGGNLMAGGSVSAWLFLPLPCELFKTLTGPLLLL